MLKGFSRILSFGITGFLGYKPQIFCYTIPPSTRLMSNEHVDEELVEEKFGVWKPFLDLGKAVPMLSSEAKAFFQVLGKKDPLEMLLKNKHYSEISKIVNSTLQFTADDEVQEFSRYFLQSRDALPLRLLIVFYGAKLIGKSEALGRMSTTTQALIESQHLVLGIATEFLYLSQLLHARTTEKTGKDSKNNKIKVLIGDLLITQLYASLATLRSNEAAEIMSDVLVKLSEDSFPLSMRNSENNILIMEDCSSVMFGNAFKSAAILSGHDFQTQLLAEAFGKSFGQICQFSHPLRTHQGLTRNCVDNTAQNLDEFQNKYAIALESTLKLISNFAVESSTESKTFHALVKIIATEFEPKLYTYN